MKTVTVTKNVGEYLGPIDWSYDFESHGWDHGGCMNPDCVQQAVKALQVLDLAPDPKQMLARLDGYWESVLCVGMYDGWPFWCPTPSVLVVCNIGNASSEWKSWCGLRAVRNAPAAADGEREDHG